MKSSVLGLVSVRAMVKGNVLAGFRCTVQSTGQEDYNIKHNAADALLKFLRDWGHKHLLSTAKTFLKTDPVESQME